MTIQDRDLLEGRDPSDLGPDVDACDSEPIRTPGSIQPYGLLLVADNDGHVFGGAGDLEGRLTSDWLGRTLADLLGETAAAQALAASDGVATALDQVKGTTTEVFNAVTHRTAEALFVELEPSQGPLASAAQVLSQLDAAAASLERTNDLRELCDRAAAVFRKLTGFERVMVYRFLDDDAGVVVAEDRDPALGTFLNHHFPASDIPKQARALYIHNRVRVIPDVNYTPAPLRPANRNAGLDLGAIQLRSVSPVHLQYMKNMGVAASASVSIVKDGMLWGLIACHDRSPKSLSFDVRIACQTLAGSLARRLRAREDAEHYRERIRLRSAEDGLIERLGSNGTLEAFFANTGDPLREMLGATGFAAMQGRELYVSGRCPEPDRLRDLSSWAKDLSVGQPLASHHLASRFAAAEAYAPLASGLLAVTISAEIPIVMMWLRAEQVEVVNWAGNPHKSMQATGPGGALTPRASFDAWSEARRGRSRPWTLGEMEAANRLRRSLFEARQNRRVRDLNAQLTATLEDKETLLVQKDYLIKEVNHRVQNSLQLVSAFLGLQARSLNDPQIIAHLDEAQRRLAAVALVHRRLYSDDRVETVDLARYLEDLCTEMRTSMGLEWGEKLSLDLTPILVSADRAVNVGLILTELVINAQKYAYGGASGPISVRLEQQRNQLRLIVSDRGGGKAGTRKGFGTRMLTAMVDGLGGAFEEGDNEPGLRVVVTAPVGEGSPS